MSLDDHEKHFLLLLVSFSIIDQPCIILLHKICWYHFLKCNTTLNLKEQFGPFVALIKISHTIKFNPLLL